MLFLLHIIVNVNETQNREFLKTNLTCAGQTASHNLHAMQRSSPDG